MEQLKVAIADKILEVSSGDSDSMKRKFREIQRFSDFAEACKSLMLKYPAIEEELLRMVRDDDFDTAKASRRVDSVLEREHSPAKSTDFYRKDEPIGPAQDSATVSPIVIANTDDATTLLENNDTFQPNPEPVEPTFIVAEGQDGKEEIVYSTLGEETLEDEAELKKKRTIMLILKIVGVALLLFAAYFVLTNYWKYIVIGIGIVAAAYIAWRLYKHHQSKKA